MRSACFFFLLILFCKTSFAQTKKEQIEVLILQKDSLSSVLEKERQLNSNRVKELETKISKINSDMGLIQRELVQSKKGLADSKRELAAKKEEIEGFRVGQVLRDDIIRSLREELHQIKASNFETFLPYFLNEVFLEYDFDSLLSADSPIVRKFIDSNNLDFGVFSNPQGIFCVKWALKDVFYFGERPDIARLSYFPNRLASERLPVCHLEEPVLDGIYYKEIGEFPSSDSLDDYGNLISIPPQGKFKPLKKMMVQIMQNDEIVQTIFFVKYNDKWHLVYLYYCDCSA
jgi:hypothetical protein